MVPIKTESMLYFSVRLDDGASEVCLERVFVS
jgi:hypothetical protein